MTIDACHQPALCLSPGLNPPPVNDPEGEADALLRLVLCGGPVAPRRKLLEGFGSACAVLAAGGSAWRDARLDPDQIARLRADDGPELGRAREWLVARGHHLLGWGDTDYPPLLRRAPNAPLALFVAGDPSLLWRPGIAIVGSRQPTPAGRDNAAAFARAFTRAGLMVSSGAAAGIDTAAHRATLDAGGTTIAVLGTGPDVAYPPDNAGLLDRITDTGALVSEHPPGTGPRKEHFPSRNRILAALTSGTVVVEAAIRSGALITARLAAEAGREVFALPGSIHNPMARGCHRLIRDGAILVESPDEVLDALSRQLENLVGELRESLAIPDAMAERPPRPERPAVRTSRQTVRPVQRGEGQGPTADDPDSHRLWNALGHDPTDMDQLVARTGLTAADLSSMLLLMELEGRVTAQHGRYHRNG